MYLPFAANKNNKKRPSIINYQPTIFTTSWNDSTKLQILSSCRTRQLRTSAAMIRCLTFHLSVKVTREQQSLSYSRHYPYTYLGICLYRYFPFDPQKRIYRCGYRYLDTYYNNILPILSWYFFVFLLASFRWF